jgi:uncharacterized protein
MANPFSYLELHSADAAKARAFYTELFGWKTKDTQIPGGVYTEVDTQQGIPAGMITRRAGWPGGWLAYVQVASLDESLERAKGLGAKLVQPRGEVPGEGFFAVVEDPAGVAIGLFERKKG